MDTVTAYKIPAAEWAKREANAECLADEARRFFEPDDGEAAWWFVTGGWPQTIVEGAEVTTCREWLRVRATPERIRAFYDRIRGHRIVISTNFDGDHADFTPA